MKIFATFVVALAAVGCGDPGSSGGDAGAVTSGAVCRAPVGCTALPFGGGEFAGLCSYACTNGDRVCVPQADGGVVDPLSLRPSGFPYAAITTAPYAANLAGDPMNCGRCGNACPAATRYCVRGACSPTP